MGYGERGLDMDRTGRILPFSENNTTNDLATVGDKRN